MGLYRGFGSLGVNVFVGGVSVGGVGGVDFSFGDERCWCWWCWFLM